MAEIEFDRLFIEGSGNPPYDYQCRIAAEGLPELLTVPTGAGKTMAVLAAWLWRRRCHPETAIRASTPRWLVMCLPMRVLTEQTVRVARRFLDATDFGSEVKVHTLMGGQRDAADDLRTEPQQDAVIVGTLDMLLSRAINRGYGESRFAWPIDFGLFNSGCHWVFDEVQLMGPALETSRQLDGLRRRFGTALPTSSTWMSATIPDDRLITVDNTSLSAPVVLAATDLQGPLARRLNAAKLLRQLEVDQKDPKRRGRQIAEALIAAHRPASLTLAVHNTIAAARATHAALADVGTGVEVCLLHSRFRPDDRRAAEAQAIAAPIGSKGRIVVTTQVLEAGVDVTAAVLFTEASPWPSLVQRAGRCNRDGERSQADLLWAAPMRPAPYPADDVDASVAELERLEGTRQTVTSLREVSVPTTKPRHAVLRAVDLLNLFDTAPDLAGNDVDISSFIRVDDDVDVLVAWRDMQPEGPVDAHDSPESAELCPAPLAEVRTLVRDGIRVWTFDHLRERNGARWRLVAAETLRPGMVVVIDSHEGRYTPTGGWDMSAREMVEPVGAAGSFVLAASEEAVDDDDLSILGGRTVAAPWYGLTEHLADVEKEVSWIWNALALNQLGSLTGEHHDAAALAGRLHDVGKCHSEFQTFLLATAADDDERPIDEGPWAKSGGSLHGRHKRKGFRHELASTLSLLDAGRVILDSSPEPDLVRYLVASHHGRIRMGIRALPDENPPPGETAALGIYDGEALPEVNLPGGEILPASVMRLEAMLLGGSQASPSWTARSLELRDRPDLGPFRLAFLEALVRLADWRASARVAGGGT